MKRFLTFIITLILTATLFAESYKVVKVEGKVFVNDTQAQIEQILTEEDVLNVRPNASITLQIIGDKFEQRTFKKPSNRITAKTVWLESAVGKGGLKKMKIADASHIAPPIEGTRKGVATAASRASEAKEDFIWDVGEEE